MDEEKELKRWMKKFEELKQTSMSGENDCPLPKNYELFQEHIRDIKERCTKRTQVNHLSFLIRFTKYCRKPFTELTKSDLGDYFDTLARKADNTITSVKKQLKLS